MRINAPMLWTGFLMIVFGCGAIQLDLRSYSFWLGAGISINGILLFYFGIGENRNLYRLRRQFLSLKKDLLAIFD